MLLVWRAYPLSEPNLKECWSLCVWIWLIPSRWFCACWPQRRIDNCDTFKPVQIFICQPRTIMKRLKHKEKRVTFEGFFWVVWSPSLAFCLWFVWFGLILLSGFADSFHYGATLLLCFFFCVSPFLVFIGRFAGQEQRSKCECCQHSGGDDGHHPSAPYQNSGGR